MIQSTILKKFAISLACAASLASGAALAGPIAVGTSYSFNLTNTANPSLGTGTLATVTLVQTSATKVDVRVALASGSYSFASTGVGPTFVFNLPAAYSSATVALTGVSNTNGIFSVLPYSAPVANPTNSTDYNLTPDGIFTNAIGLSSTGSSANYGAPLTFSVTGSSGISLTDFTTSYARNNGQPGGYEFGLDMFNGTRTGTAAFLGTTPTLITPPGTTTGNGDQNVPEPASLALMGLGLLCVAARRKRKQM